VEKGFESVGRLGPDAEVGVGFGEEDIAGLAYGVGGGDGQAPARLSVEEGEVDEDGLEVVLVVLGDVVDEAELLGELGCGVMEQGEGKAVLLGGEVGLALGFGADGDEQGAALADLAVEVAPGFKLGDAVGAPAAAEELDDQGPEGEEIAAADEVA